MNSSRILLAVPTRGQVDYQTVAQLNLIRDMAPGLPPILFERGSTGAGATRNRIAARFLDGDYRVLIMVDDDVMPPPRLLGIVEHLDRFDVVAAPTLMCRDGHIAWNVDNGEGRWRQDTPRELIPAVMVGTGCIAIHRRVLERLGAGVFRERYDERGVLVESDDVGFCRAVVGAGFRVGADFTRLCDHRVCVGAGSLALVRRA